MLKLCHTFQAAAAAVSRTAASEAASKNGRLDRALMRLDRALDPTRYAYWVSKDASHKCRGLLETTSTVFLCDALKHADVTISSCC